MLWVLYCLLVELVFKKLCLGGDLMGLWCKLATSSRIFTSTVEFWFDDQFFSLMFPISFGSFLLVQFFISAGVQDEKPIMVLSFLSLTGWAFTCINCKFDQFAHSCIGGSRATKVSMPFFFCNLLDDYNPPRGVASVDGFFLCYNFFIAYCEFRLFPTFPLPNLNEALWFKANSNSSCLNTLEFILGGSSIEGSKKVQIFTNNRAYKVHPLIMTPIFFGCIFT